MGAEKQATTIWLDQTLTLIKFSKLNRDPVYLIWMRVPLIIHDKGFHWAFSWRYILGMKTIPITIYGYK